MDTSSHMGPFACPRYHPPIPLCTPSRSLQPCYRFSLKNDSGSLEIIHLHPPLCVLFPHITYSFFLKLCTNAILLSSRIHRQLSYRVPSLAFTLALFVLFSVFRKWSHLSTQFGIYLFCCCMADLWRSEPPLSTRRTSSHRCSFQSQVDLEAQPLRYWSQ